MNLCKNFLVFCIWKIGLRYSNTAFFHYNYPMNLYILRWNPNISSYTTESHLEIISNLKKDLIPSDFSWDVHEYLELQKRDMFILQQVGTDHDGIAMIGKFKDKCFEDDSWRNDGTKLYYAGLWVMDAFDCDTENPLPAEKYEKLFPQIDWHGGHSGVIVPEEIDDQLVNQIEEDLIKAGHWQPQELDHFMDHDFEKAAQPGSTRPTKEDLADGKILLELKHNYLNNPSKENFVSLVCCLHDSEVLIPMHIEKNEVGDTQYFPMLAQNDAGDSAIPIFSNEDQLAGNYQDDTCEIYGIPVTLCADILQQDPDIKTIILDPFTESYIIDQDLAKVIAELEYKE